MKLLVSLLVLSLAGSAHAAACTEGFPIKTGEVSPCDGDVVPTDALVALLKIQDDHDEALRAHDRVKAFWEKERAIILADLEAERAARAELLKITVAPPMHCPPERGFFEHPLVVGVLVAAAASAVTYFVVR